MGYFNNVEFKIEVPFQKSAILKESREFEGEGFPEDLPPGSRVIEGYASTKDLDYQDDIVTEKALNKIVEFLKTNRTMLHNHDLDNAIGRVVDTKLTDEGAWIKGLISSTEDKIWTKVQEGILNKFSIAGKITKAEEVWDATAKKYVRHILDLEIYEVSLVSVPANAKARAIKYYIVKSLDDHVKDNYRKTNSPVEFVSPIVKFKENENGGLDITTWSTADKSEISAATKFVMEKSNNMNGCPILFKNSVIGKVNNIVSKGDGFGIEATISRTETEAVQKVQERILTSVGINSNLVVQKNLTSDESELVNFLADGIELRSVPLTKAQMLDATIRKQFDISKFNKGDDSMKKEELQKKLNTLLKEYNDTSGENLQLVDKGEGGDSSKGCDDPENKEDKTQTPPAEGDGGASKAEGEGQPPEEDPNKKPEEEEGGMKELSTKMDNMIEAVNNLAATLAGKAASEEGDDGDGDGETPPAEPPAPAEADKNKTSDAQKSIEAKVEALTKTVTDALSKFNGGSSSSKEQSPLEKKLATLEKGIAEIQKLSGVSQVQKGNESGTTIPNSPEDVTTAKPTGGKKEGESTAISDQDFDAFGGLLLGKYGKAEDKK
jgi:HK97 family phage prohead protease